MLSPLSKLAYVRSRFDAACAAFMRSGGVDLLRRRSEGGATEQKISGEFARHLEKVLRDDGVLGDANVDSEYYYDGDQAKMMAAMEQYAEIIELARRKLRYNGKVGIRPDIIVHRPGRQGPNHLVIEIKKRSNASTDQERFDLLKLKMMTSTAQIYRYSFGLQVRAFDSNDPAERRLEVLSIWEKGARVGLDTVQRTGNQRERRQPHARYRP